AEDGFDAFLACAGGMTRRRALRVDAEVARRYPFQVRDHRRYAAEGSNVPGERQQIAPVAVGMEKVTQRAIVVAPKRALETGEPVVGDGIERLGGGGHGASKVHQFARS